MNLLNLGFYSHINIDHVHGQKALHFEQALHLCSKDKRKSYRFGITRGRVTDGRIFILE